MPWQEITAPSVLAVNLAEARAHLRVTSQDENTLIETYVAAAVRMVESRTRRAFVQRSFLFVADDFPEWDTIELPVSPLVSVTYVKYIATDGVLTTYSSTNYAVDTVSPFGRVVLAQGATWPVVKTDYPNAVQVTFVAGYGTDDRATPAAAKAAILHLAAHLYENRTPVEVGAGAAVEVPITLQYALDTERLFAV